jgi:hypothetical protein
MPAISSSVAKRTRFSLCCKKTGGSASIREYDFSRGVFSRLQTFRYVQASEFVRLPGRSYCCSSSRRAAEAFTSEQNMLRREFGGSMLCRGLWSRGFDLTGA